MRRRGSMPFVVEIKSSRRRFAPGIPGPVLLEKRNPGFHGNGADALFAMPWNAGESAGDPSVEEARLAADRLFGGPGPSVSSRERGDQKTNERAVAVDQTGAGIGSREEAPDERPKPDASANAPDGKPRTGRILESLTSKDPLEALFRQKAEEEVAPRRGRPPGSRNVRRDKEPVAGELRRNQFPMRPAADLSAPPAITRTVGVSSTAEPQPGDPHPPVVHSPVVQENLVGSPRRPATRRKPTGRTGSVNTPRTRKVPAGAKQKPAARTARNASGRRAGANKRRPSGSVVTSGVSRRAAQAKGLGRNKGKKQLSAVSRKGAAAKKVVRKQVAGSRAVRSNLARNAATKKIRNAAASKSTASKATGKTTGKTTSRRNSVARTSAKTKASVRTPKSRSKTARRTGAPAKSRAPAKTRAPAKSRTKR